MAEISFEALKKKYHWNPIRNCPGRFILVGGVSSVTPEALCGKPARVFENTTMPDPVMVIAIEGGGVISYRKGADSYIHTLCNPEGFGRKLKSIGISDLGAEPFSPKGPPALY